MPRFKIRKGVPLPERGTGFVREMKKMKVGDSIVIDEWIRRAVPSCANQLGIKVATRTEENGELAVWRTE